MIVAVTVLGVPDRSWAILIARLVLGLIFGMAGWGKLFRMGPAEHARRYFLEPFAKTWIPNPILWTFGVVIPFLEFIAGWLVFVGLFVQPALLVLSLVLVKVTYGHLLDNYLYRFNEHVIPRLGLVLFLLVMPRSEDILSLDHLLGL